MSELKKKRPRSENWLEEDKSLLKELVKERVDIIENKNTDTNTSFKKNAAWSDLLLSFNGMCKGSKRTLPQLKTQWGATKVLAKKIKSVERREIAKTGGGPPPIVVPSTSDDISVWLPNEFVIDENEFDSDNKNLIIEHPDNSPMDTEMKNSIPSDQLVQKKYMNIPDSSPGDERMENVITSNQVPQKEVVKPKKKKKLIQPSPLSHTAAADIARTEIECRQELHKMQMEVEDMKKRNLELEALLLKKKIEYYDKKIKNLDD